MLRGRMWSPLRWLDENENRQNHSGNFASQLPVINEKGGCLAAQVGDYGGSGARQGEQNQSSCNSAQHFIC
ncbi:hypothetical protein ACLKA7_003289 [Drosophila subpalustris]